MFGDQYVSPAMRPGEVPGGGLGHRLAAQGLMVFGPRFRGDRVGDAMHEVNIPGRAQPDGFGENGGASRRHTMQRLVPPVVDRYAETRNGWRAVLHLQYFFLERHAGYEVRRAPLRRQVRILIGRVTRCLSE